MHAAERTRNVCVMYPNPTPDPGSLQPPLRRHRLQSCVFDAAALNLIPGPEDAEIRDPIGHEKEEKRKVKKKKKGGGRRKREPGRPATKKPGRRPATPVSAALATHTSPLAELRDYG
eukprot:FR741915.1.p1 GENE.FR741915.1~~FR741915.1.p1  ORF type:complete len:129 (+),score=10.09 FR741915.1:38-388(+)